MKYARVIWWVNTSGLPAKRFAEFDPAPSLEWLDIFSEACYQRNDLKRFGFSTLAILEQDVCFSLINRPTPYTLAPWMSLASEGVVESVWDNVMRYLACWALRHLNNPKLILWVAQCGGQLHNHWVRLIETKINYFVKLEREGDTAKLDLIRSNAPDAIPDPQMRTLWRLLLSGRVKSSQDDSSFYTWKDRFERDGLTTSIRLELRDLLAPRVSLKKAFRWGDNTEDTDKPISFIERKITSATEHVHSELHKLTQTQDWHTTLILLFDDLQQLLHDTLDLSKEIERADDRYDCSFLDMPSISEHWQNRGTRNWSALIVLLRDSWLAIRNSEPERATKIAQKWFSLPYPTFKRLALFAASHDECIDGEQWVV
ncbi:hypothetical protein AGMMS49957_18650 [Synergistales bacterium]|nr:hypothetical protein AGMMS49957_18650 [Synergistales bacterium]